mgnify:CR=1 FL=1
MTGATFISEIISLYGEFTSEGMKRAVLARISELSDRQRDKLFDTYIRNIPGTYKPDLKNVLDCMDKAGIRPGEKVRTCEACGKSWSSTQMECPACGYTRECGDPDAYRREMLDGYGKFNKEVLRGLLLGMKDKCVWRRGYDVVQR